MPGLALCAAGMLLLAACGGGAANSAALSAASSARAANSAAAPANAAGSRSGQLQSLIDSAAREGKLELVMSEDTIGGSETAKLWADGFNKLYGLKLQVQFTPGPAMPEMAGKIVQEYQANRTASTDVFLGAETHIISLMKAQALMPADWPSWAFNIQNPRLVVPGNIAVEVSSNTPGITYNANKVAGAAVPKTMQDLLKPEYKGRIASTPYAAIFDDLSTPELWGEQRTLDYLKKFAEQITGLIRSGEVQRVATGEFDLFALNTDGAAALKGQAQGVPLAHVVPNDAAFIQYRYMGVPKNAAHPNAAQLFANYILSREAQDILYQRAFTDHYLLPGSKSAPAVQKLQASGVAFHDLDVQFIQRNDPQKLDAFLKQAVDILQNKR